METSAVLSIPVVALSALAGLGSYLLAQTRPTALVGATVYTSPFDQPLSPGVILIQGGVIRAVGAPTSVTIPPDAQRLDLTGLTITAGFWNSHVHFTQRKWADAAKAPAADLEEQLQTMLTRYGFTSVFDTGSIWENTRALRDRIESGEISGPRIRSTGEILFPERGFPPDIVFDITGTMKARFPEVADATQARTVARSHLDAGTDGIKVYAATWAPPIVALPADAIKAAAEEAHRAQRPLFAHPSNRDGLVTAVRNGADIVVHTAPQSGLWDGELVTEMKEAGVAIIPTLKLWQHELRHDRTSIRKRFAGLAVEQLRAWSSAGGTVLFGTDVGYMDDYDPTDEYVLMAAAGMGFPQVLASLTTAPAQRFQASSQLGRIAPGLKADLVVLGADPATDIRAFASVRQTFRDGKPIYSATR